MQIVTCRKCGAAIVLDAEHDWQGLHVRWHAELEKPRRRAASAKKVLDPAEEPEGFSGWLHGHALRAGLSVPRERTTYRSDLARTFAALEAEGYSRQDFDDASRAVLADEHMVAGGWIKPENVLRKSKIGGRVEEGRRLREQGAGKYDHLGGE